MLGCALVFFIIATIAGVLSVGVIAGSLAGLAQIAFFAFLLLFTLAMIAGLLREAPPR
jgi:uncharacterized membrane protein YtjA (UPF0391 family)